MLAPVRRAFTLVEILIVVIILGILAAIVVPQFAGATEQATADASVDQLQRIRRALAVYYVRNSNVYPNIVAGNTPAAWGELLTASGYLKEPPRNLWVGQTNMSTVIIRNTPDPAYQTTHGWIWDPPTGTLMAGSFDAQDQPYPRP